MTHKAREPIHVPSGWSFLTWHRTRVCLPEVGVQPSYRWVAVHPAASRGRHIAWADPRGRGLPIRRVGVFASSEGRACVPASQDTRAWGCIFSQARSPPGVRGRWGSQVEWEPRSSLVRPWCVWSPSQPPVPLPGGVWAGRGLMREPGHSRGPWGHPAHPRLLAAAAALGSP